ncbi:glycosyltransferase family 4 protein [Acinetobacter bereziniae]|uniref:glycosyltransferase family 4 protein n=1 Tax=Acinetobacter bereziniae TaxID=106648 RepID=UPI002954D62C|nr:glycosyltransferase family 4 protein [Acinetobacter bereziniae]MDV8157309.1 glycosyltransferase family 4 protein [Acinetobacter bereziniae]
MFLKKILYLIPSLTNCGGMERVLTDKANYLVKTGKYDVTIMTTNMRDNDSPFYDLDSNIKVVNLEIFFDKIFDYKLLEKIIKNKKLLVLYKIKLENYIFENKIDICVSMGAKELDFFSQLNVPVLKVFESHFNPTVRSSFISDHQGNALIWRLIGKYRDWQYKKQTKELDRVVVLTKNAKYEWEKTHSNIIVINNPSPFDIVNNRKFNCYERVIAVGRIEDQKGFDLLIDSWKNVYRKYPNWKLDIYGDGSKKDTLLKKISNNQLNDVITLKGVTRSIRQELLISDFYVMSSRYEGLPMVLLESIACGLPIVSFNCPTGPAEIIENNDCGLLVQNGDIGDLTEKIICMIENPDLRKRMSVIAMKKAEKYSIERIMLQWEELFDNLIMNKNS